MARQEFRTADRVRLEVQADDISTTNLVRNPNGDLGTYLWTTVLSDQTFTRSTYAFRLTSTKTAAGSPGSQALVWYQDTKVTPGQYVQASMDLFDRSNTGVRAWMNLQFFDSAGGLLSAVTGTSATAAQWTGSRYMPTTTATQIPAGTATVRLEVRMGASSLAAGWWMEFTKVALRTASTAAALSPLTYTEPYQWRDVLGKTGSIKAVHDGIGLGTLTATLYDSALDPAVSTALRSGRLIRLTAMDTTLTRQSVWSGTLLKGSAVYDLSQTDPDRRARITISAVNGVAQAANLTRQFGVLTISDLAWLLEGASVPWAVNGSGTQPSGSPTYVNIDPNKTLLDQIAVTRDSQRGYAWVDRRGVLNVADAGSRPTALAATLTESDYTALSYDYDTDRCINDLTVKALRINADGTTGEVVFGPYRDQASIDLYGAHSTEVTVQGLSDTQIASYAASVLAANSVPVRKVNSLSFPVRTTADLTVVNGTKRAMLDTYDRVRVTNATGTVDQTLRPTTITQTLNAGVRTDKWTVDVEFAADAAAAAPISVPPPPGPSTVAGSPDGSWLPLPGSTVAAWGSPFGNPQYRIVGNEVIFRGLCRYVGSTTSAAVQLAIMPAGARPPAQTIHNVNARTGGAWRLDVQTDGQFILFNGCSNGEYISLDGVRYYLS